MNEKRRRTAAAFMSVERLQVQSCMFTSVNSPQWRNLLKVVHSQTEHSAVSGGWYLHLHALFECVRSFSQRVVCLCHEVTATREEDYCNFKSLNAAVNGSGFLRTDALASWFIVIIKPMTQR